VCLLPECTGNADGWSLGVVASSHGKQRKDKKTKKNINMNIKNIKRNRIGWICNGNFTVALQNR
jgi:hypothetical protein